MDLQTRKLSIIEYLIGIQDETFFAKIEQMIKRTKDDSAQTIKAFTQNEIIKRAKQSNIDYAKGNFKTQQELEIESDNW